MVDWQGMSANKRMRTGAIIERATDAVLKSSDAEAMLHIWLVDDDASCRGQLMWLLNAEPQVDCSRCFSSASSLLATLRLESPPDAILLDVQMPVMTGIEAIRLVKHLAPSTMILMLTTFFDHRLKEEALAAGAADFLLKRNLPGEMVASVRKALA
jgi:DNA-binding NarL/FixJ family response regulator